ncbi:hypothetical protein GLOIN_2v1485488 [Rhizophagus irregularis DAOM 181602=DAOM 197198]|nr:hypothetical protein GLOIN_2v1485488 [Rhizophagus irregularis DAOM 181602=DAOM 197198]
MSPVDTPNWCLTDEALKRFNRSINEIPTYDYNTDQDEEKRFFTANWLFEERLKCFKHFGLGSLPVNSSAWTFSRISVWSLSRISVWTFSRISIWTLSRNRLMVF